MSFGLDSVGVVRSWDVRSGCENPKRCCTVRAESLGDVTRLPRHQPSTGVAA